MAATESQVCATRFTHIVVYVCEQQIYASVGLTDLNSNGDLIKMDPLRKFKAGFGRGPKRIELWIQVVTLCLSKKVADKLAFLLCEVITEKNVPDDYFVTHKVLPRTCDVRPVESVPEWFNSKVELAFENSSKFTGLRRSSRNSQRNLFQSQSRKSSADETSEDSDTSADDEEPVVDVQVDPCTIPKRSTKRKSSVRNVEDEGAQDLTSAEEERSSAARTGLSKRKAKARSKVRAGEEDDPVFMSETEASTSTQVKHGKRKTTRRKSLSSESEADKRIRSNSAVMSTPKKSHNYREKRKLISHDSPQTIDPELQSPTFLYSDAANASTSKRSFSSQMMEHTATMMQVMLENSRQMRKDFDEVKKIQRAQAKQLTLLQVALGRLSGEKRSSSDSHASVGTATSAAAATSSTCAEDQSIIDLESADGLTQSTLDKHVQSSCSAVGSIRWIRSTYGLDKAREIVRGLRKLNVPITKWPSIFEGRFAADKLMATRLLKARFTEEDLANFCMSRPSQSKAVDSSKTQATSKDSKKSLLPDKELMIDLLSLMALDGYTPQNANIRFQSALTVANRNQRSKVNDKTADSDTSVTETRVDSLQTQLVNVVIETLHVEPTAMDEDAAQMTSGLISGSQDPLASSTQENDATFDPEKTTLVQSIKLPSPLIEEDVDAVYFSESETRFVMD